MFERILIGSRYIILIGVIGSLIESFSLFLYSGLKAIFIIVDTMKGLSIDNIIDKTAILGYIQVVDLFILGAVFYIIALGLYELFINDHLNLPTWLVIHDFDDLKGKLISGLIVVLGVLFLGEALNWKGGTDLIAYGASIALVIAALSYFLRHKSKKGVDSLKGVETEEN